MASESPAIHLASWLLTVAVDHGGGRTGGRSDPPLGCVPGTSAGRRATHRPRTPSRRAAWHRMSARPYPGGVVRRNLRARRAGRRGAAFRCWAYAEFTSTQTGNSQQHDQHPRSRRETRTQCSGPGNRRHDTQRGTPRGPSKVPLRRSGSPSNVILRASLSSLGSARMPKCVAPWRATHAGSGRKWGARAVSRGWADRATASSSSQYCARRSRRRRR